MDIRAKSALIMDAESGKILWSREPDTLRFPASTTKIMTAMLLLERCTPDEIITAPIGVDKVEGASLHLKPGEQVTVGNMLYAILLRSANDGCVAAATHVSGSVPEFVKLMNKRAEDIGCTDTNFNNTNGLNDPEHTTTAHDLALIAREAMKYEPFRNIVKERKKIISRSLNAQDINMISHNKYLGMDPTADGIKTGWTRDAGQCYVGSATRDGYRIITVILKSDDWKADHAQMLDWAFKTHERVTVATAGERLGKVRIENGVDKEVSGEIIEDIRHIVVRTKPAEVTYTTEPIAALKAPIAKGQPVGKLIVSDADGWKQTYKLVAAADVAEASPLGRNMGIVLLVGGMGTGMFWMKRRGRRRGTYGRAKKRRVSSTRGTGRTPSQANRGVRPVQPQSRREIDF